MEIGAKVQSFLSYPIVKLSAGTITVAALGLAIILFFGSRIVGRFGATRLNLLLARRDFPEGSRFAIAKIVQYSATLIGVLMGLTSIGIRLDALFAASTVVLVGIGFGLQNIAQNFISGLILLFERPVSRGDFVQLGHSTGTVVDIGMRATHIVTRDEVTIIVPNSELVTAQVINHSQPTRNLRISVQVAVAYGTDTAKISELLMSVALGEPQVLRQPPPEVRFEEFGESGMQFAVYAWIGSPAEDRRIASHMRFAIDAAFRNAGIEIPYPQREIRVKNDAAASALRPVR
jgi:potassium efflux system protein